MMSDNQLKQIRKITIIGLGETGKLISANLFSFPIKTYQLIGDDANSDNHSKMKKYQILDITEWNLKTATQDADVIFICVPKIEVNELLKNLNEFVKDHCIIIDTSIFKKEILDYADSIFKQNVSFIGGSIIFNNEVKNESTKNYFVLIPSSKATSESMDITVNLIKSIGLSPLFFDIDEYDNFMFALYGLPNLISTAYRNLMMDSPSWREIKKLYGSNFLKLAEISLKEPEDANYIPFLKEKLPSDWINRFNENLAYFTESKNDSNQKLIKNSEISRDKFFKLKEGINPNTDFSVKSNDLNHGMLELFLGSKLTGYFTNRGRIDNNKSQDKQQK